MLEGSIWPFRWFVLVINVESCNIYMSAVIFASLSLYIAYITACNLIINGFLLIRVHDKHVIKPTINPSDKQASTLSTTDQFLDNTARPSKSTHVTVVTRT